MRSFKELFFCIVIILISGIAQAEYDGTSFAIHHQYQSPRPLGMGDAFVAVANDYNAVMYNPAGLARRDDGEINAAIGGEITSSFLTFANDISNAQKSSATTSAQQTAIQNVIQNRYGSTYGGRTQMFEATWVRPGWGLAIIPFDMSGQMTPHQGVGPSINSTMYLDTTVAYGYGADIHDFSYGRLSWGVTGKFVNRGYFSKSISALELAMDPNLLKTSDLKEGYGIDADLGFLFTPFLPSEGMLSALRLVRPTFGLVVRNVAETGFNQSLKLINKNKTDAPEKMYRVIDLGSRWEYPSVWIFSGRGVLDIRDIMHPGFTTKKALHAGFEFDWAVANWWKGAYRVGLNQGYWTAGVSALFTMFSLDLYSYGEDVGPSTSPAENRVYGLKMNMNF